MRLAVNITIPNPEGNAAITGGKMGEAVMAFVDKWHPEATYFYLRDGQRGATFFVNVDDAFQLPSLAEGFFLGLNAKVSATPCMTLEDLKKGLALMQSGKR